MSRKPLKPREAETYRGARRKEAKKLGLLPEWRAKAQSRAKHQPYQIKAPKVERVTLPDGETVVTKLVPRDQPKTYQPNGLLERARRWRQQVRIDQRHGLFPYMANWPSTRRRVRALPLAA